MGQIFDTQNDSGDYNITKFQTNNTIQHVLDRETMWVRDLLSELNENADEKNPQEYLAETNISIDLSITKKFKAEFAEYFIITGQLDFNYATKCVKTLKDMKLEKSVPIKVCFVDLSLEGNDLFAEQTETFIDNDMYELYFYSERKISLKEMINEMIYLNIDAYPTLDKESELLHQNEQIKH